MASQASGVNAQGGFGLHFGDHGSLKTADEIEGVSASYPPSAPSHHVLKRDGESYTSIARELCPFVMNGVGIGATGAGVAAGAGAATIGAGTAATATTTGVMVTTHVVQATIAGLVNAGVQGVAIGAGMQDKFSYGQVLNSMTAMGISGGATSLTEGLGAVASQVSKVALANVAEQLVLLKVGAIDKFSLENVLQSVGATLTGMGVNAVLGKAGAPMKNPYVNAGAGLASSAVTQQLTTHHLQMDALAQQAVGAGIQLSADHYLAAKQSNRELKDQQASTPHKVRKQAAGQHKPVDSVHGHEVMNDPALQIAKPSQNGLFGRSPSAPGTMYVPEPRLETEAIGYQLSEQNRARMQQHQAASSSASGSRRHLFAIPSSEKTGSLADVVMHKPAGYTQQTVSNRYHVVDQKWQVTTRTLGALQAIGGGLEVSFGVELAATGVGAIPGALLVGSGIDNLGAGAHTFISGQSQQTTLEMVMTQNGVSAGNAATIQAGADFALNLGGTAAMHAPEVYQMGTRFVSSIAEPVSQFAQRTTEVMGEQIGAMYRMFPGREGWSFLSKPLEAESLPKYIKTPYGKAIQSETEIAINARSSVEQGAWLYRGGRLGRSAGPEGQFWSLENPLSPGYAEKYGLPIENTKFDFVEVAVVKPGSSFITREAPGIGINGGGGIEVVVNPGEPKLQYFHMPWEPEHDSVKQRFVSRN